MKRAPTNTAMVVVAWSPVRAVGQCCGDCSGDGAVTVDEIIAVVNRALEGCSDDGICRMKKCNQDAVQVGNVCVDKYEASVWVISSSNTRLIKAVQNGKIATTADLSGATQRGHLGDDYGTGCPDTGNGCKDFYAVSIAGVTPSRYLTWFHAAAACANAGKRLLTNQEWQVADLPGALFRGGGFYFGPGDGVFAVVGAYRHRLTIALADAQHLAFDEAVFGIAAFRLDVGQRAECVGRVATVASTTAGGEGESEEQGADRGPCHGQSYPPDSVTA
jgi:hypothetical protein